MLKKGCPKIKKCRIIFFVILACSMYLGLGLNVAHSQGINLESLQKAANKEGKLIWYESSPEDQFVQVEKAFNKRYPNIKLEHVRLRGGDVGTRVIAESKADAPTGDVVSSGLDILMELDKRNLLSKNNWGDLGFPQDIIATNYALKSMVVCYIIDYNSDLVSPADAPQNWEDLLNPKWKGKLGIWQKPSGIAELSPAWGDDKVLDFAAKLAQQNPVIYSSNYPLNNSLGAGEISVAITNYHTVFPSLKKGAPIKMVFASPVPYEALCSSITSKGSHSSAAMLFMTWFHSPEGAKAYEDATNRGNPWIAGTKTYDILQGKELSTYSPEQSGELKNMINKIEKILIKK